jgi:hypothetical protein
MRRHFGFEVSRDGGPVKEERQMQLHLQDLAKGSKKRILYTFDREQPELVNTLEWSAMASGLSERVRCAPGQEI